MQFLTRSYITAGMLFAVAPVLGAQTAGQTAASPQDQFARYTTPGQCEQAAIRLTSQYWRDKRPDTVVYAPATDSVPTPVVQAARKCAARFSVESAKERELLDLAQLYILGNQDSLAHAAIKRLLATSREQETVQRGWTISQIAGTFLSAAPRRLTEATQYLAQLEALGKPVATWRMFTQTSFARHYMSVNDLASAVTAGKAAIAASADQPQNDRIDWAYSILSAYASLADPTSVTEGGPAALAILDQMGTAVEPLRPAGTKDLEQLMYNVKVSRVPYTLFGTTGKPLTADHWYNTKAGDTTFPKSGVATLIVFGFHACSGGCYPTYATLNRLHNQFGSRGLQIVLVGGTSGYYRNRLAVPAAESDSAGKYFGEFLKLPAAIAIDETEFSKRHDGRRVNAPTENARNYSKGRSAVLVGKDGQVKLVVNALPQREETLKAVIEAAIK